MRALVRRVPATLESCQLTHLERHTIDIALARRQHASYCQALRSAGLQLIELDSDAALPDCPFVEDLALDLGGGLRVLCRPGSAARRGERAEVRRVLQELGDVVEMPSELHCDGGDVLQVGGRIFVGRSTRSDPAAVEWLAAVSGRAVTPVELDGVLHLKTGVTALDDRTLLVAPGRVDTQAFAGFELVPADEPNVLRLPDRLLARPETASLLLERGYRVDSVDISELARAEAGLTCLSVLLS